MRIALVNDLALAREALSRAVTDGGHTIAWVAEDGREAVQRCGQDTPDLILMDLVMPEMDGAQATQEIMAKTPCPILVVTASVQGNSELVYEAMGFGALDATTTPTFGNDGEVNSASLLKKIDRIALIAGRAHHKPGYGITQMPFGSPATPFPPFLAIGASTGGPQALSIILGALPGDFPAAVGIVQHVDSEFAAGLAEWLNQRTELHVSLAQDREHPRPGHVYVSAGDRHLRMDSGGRFHYTLEPESLINRPSVDIFFKSLAYAYPKTGCAVLLTGMGRDGAEGLRALKDSGWHTIAQDKASSVVYGMPKAAAERGAAVSVLGLAHIASAIKGHFVLASGGS